MKNERAKHAGRIATLLCAALITLAGCAGGDLAPIRTDGFQLEEDEKRIWKEARELQAGFDRSGFIYDDPIVTAYVKQVALKVIPDEIESEVSFQIKVVRHPAPNAFALPHGAVFVHSGFLARMENEAQLAAVLAHEISHVIHRHTLQTFRTVKRTAAVGTTLGVITAPAGLPGTGVMLLGAVGALAALSGYSQSLEEEADTEGLRLMVNAGYNPVEAVKVMANVKRYVEQEEIKEPFFFSSHPRLAERRASYQKLVDTQYKDIAGFRGEAEFTAALTGAFLDNARLETARGRYTLAQEAIERCLAADPDNYLAHYSLAELFRQRALEGDHESAEKHYQRTVDLAPNFAEGHRGMGLLDYKQGRKDLAREHFANYLALDPTAKDRAHIEQYLSEIDPRGKRP